MWCWCLLGGCLLSGSKAEENCTIVTCFHQDFETLIAKQEATILGNCTEEDEVRLDSQNCTSYIWLGLEDHEVRDEQLTDDFKTLDFCFLGRDFRCSINLKVFAVSLDFYMMFKIYGKKYSFKINKTDNNKDQLYNFDDVEIQNITYTIPEKEEKEEEEDEDECGKKEIETFKIIDFCFLSRYFFCSVDFKRKVYYPEGLYFNFNMDNKTHDILIEQYYNYFDGNYYDFDKQFAAEKQSFTIRETAVAQTPVAVAQTPAPREDGGVENQYFDPSIIYIFLITVCLICSIIYIYI